MPGRSWVTGSSSNAAGDLIVGYYNGRAAYWRSVNRGWTGPTLLPGDCTNAWAVDDNGNIAASGCNAGAQRRAALFLARDSTMMMLGGVGPTDTDAGVANHVTVGRLSRRDCERRAGVLAAVPVLTASRYTYGPLLAHAGSGPFVFHILSSLQFPQQQYQHRTSVS
jgi:hypothetical protein